MIVDVSVKGKKTKFERKGPTGNSAPIVGVVITVVVIAATAIVAEITGLFDKIFGKNEVPKDLNTPPVSTPVSTSTSSSTNTPNPTSVPLTETQIGFGLTEANKNRIINVDNGLNFAYYDVNGVERAHLVNGLNLYDGPDGMLIANVTDLITQKPFDRITDQDRSLDISPEEGEPKQDSLEYFRKRYDDQNVRVTFLRSTTVRELVARVKALGYPIDETRLEDMKGDKTLEEIVNWIIEVIPEPFWPILTDYVSEQKDNSQIPTSLNEVRLGDITRRALLINYVDGTKKVVFAEIYTDENGNRKYRNTFPNSENDATQEYIGDNELKSLNMEFFERIRPGVEIEKINSFILKDFGEIPLANKLKGALSNLTSEDTIGYLKQIYEMLDEEYWYLPPKDVQTIKNGFKQLATEIVADRMFSQLDNLMGRSETVSSAPKLKLDDNYYEKALHDLRNQEVTRENLNPNVSYGPNGGDSNPEEDPKELLKVANL